MITKKNAPYANTSADPDRTRSQIDKLFRDYGVSGVRWTTNYEQNLIILEFIMETEVEGVKRTFLVKVSPKLFYNKHKTYNPKTGRHETINAPNYAQSFRFMFYQLKAKLEAVSYGWEEAQKVFLSDIVVKLPDGKAGTVGELLGKKMLDTALPPGESE